MRVAILWMALVLGGAAAAAQPVDVRTWTGADYMRAPGDKRGAWLLAVVKVWVPKLRPEQQGAVALRVGTCLEEMMTPRKRGETAAVIALGRSPAGDLAALCALHIPEIAAANAR